MLALTRTALCQTALSSADAAERRDLIDSATQAADHGNHAQALELYQHAAQMLETPSLRRYIAEEQAALNQVVEALGSAEECTAEESRTPSHVNHAENLAACRALVTRLSTLVARVQIDVPASPPAGLHVSVNGAEVPSRLWGVPYLVAAGATHITASADDSEPFVRDVTVTAGSVAHVAIAMHARPAPVASAPPENASPAPTHTPPTTVATTSPTSTTPSGAGVSHEESTAAPQPTETASSPSGLPVGPIVVAGAGVLAFGAAAAFWALRNSALSNCTLGMQGGQAAEICNEPSTGPASMAQTWTVATNVALGVGGVAIAAGVVWFVWDRLHRRSSNPVAEHVRLEVDPSGRSAGIAVQGCF